METVLPVPVHPCLPLLLPDCLSAEYFPAVLHPEVWKYVLFFVKHLHFSFHDRPQSYFMSVICQKPREGSSPASGSQLADFLSCWMTICFFRCFIFISMDQTQNVLPVFVICKDGKQNGKHIHFINICLTHSRKLSVLSHDNDTCHKYHINQQRSQ